MCVCLCACVSHIWIFGAKVCSKQLSEKGSVPCTGKGHVNNNCPSKSNHRNDDRKQELPLFVLNPYFYFFSSACKSSFLVPHADHSTSPPRQSLRQFPHNWFTVFCDHLSYIICTHSKKKPKFKLLRKHSLSPHQQRWPQPETKRGILSVQKHAEQQRGFPWFALFCNDTVTPCNTSIKKISVVLLCNGQRCFLSILRSLQDTPVMLSTPPKSFQQIMKPVRGKCQRANLLNSKQSNTWARHFLRVLSALQPMLSLQQPTHHAILNRDVSWWPNWRQHLLTDTLARQLTHMPVLTSNSV